MDKENLKKKQENEDTWCQGEFTLKEGVEERDIEILLY